MAVLELERGRYDLALARFDMGSGLDAVAHPGALAGDGLMGGSAAGGSAPASDASDASTAEGEAASADLAAITTADGGGGEISPSNWSPTLPSLQRAFEALRPGAALDDRWERLALKFDRDRRDLASAQESRVSPLHDVHLAILRLGAEARAHAGARRLRRAAAVSRNGNTEVHGPRGKWPTKWRRFWTRARRSRWPGRGRPRPRAAATLAVLAADAGRDAAAARRARLDPPRLPRAGARGRTADGGRAFLSHACSRSASAGDRTACRRGARSGTTAARERRSRAMTRPESARSRTPRILRVPRGRAREGLELGLGQGGAHAH